jgi:hypothetical protein
MTFLRLTCFSLLVAALGFGCGDDGTPMTADAGPDGSIGGDGGRSDGGGADGGGASDGGGETPDGGGPGPQIGRVVVGHAGGESFQIHQFDAETFEATSGSPYTAANPYDDVETMPGLGFIALPIPPDDHLVVLDGETMQPVQGSPYSTAVSPQEVAFDPNRRRLYVFSSMTGPGGNQLTVFDTSSLPFEEIDSSPFDFGAVATQMEVDAETGRLFGVSATTVWAAEVTGGSANMLFGTPENAGSLGGMDLDPDRRRLYFTEKQAPAQVHVRDLDSFEALEGSPVSVQNEGTDVASDLLVHPGTGDVFVIERKTRFSDDAHLRLIQPEPLQRVTTCDDPAGCVIPNVDTGLAILESEDRLFLPVLNGEAPGELSAWDISTPTNPTEVTSSDDRPEVGPVPAWVDIY